jgi:hypothetical protein
LALTVSEAALAAGAMVTATAGGVGLTAWLVTAKAKILLSVAALALVIVPLVMVMQRSPQSPEAADTSVVNLPSPATLSQEASVSPAAAAQAPASAPVAPAAAAPEGLSLTMVAADSGKPVPNVRLDYWCWVGTKVIRTNLLGTRAGTCLVPVTRQGTTELRVTTQIDDFADTRLHWRPDRGEAIPAEYTVRLARPVRIGGRVVDADDHPVAGAKVGWNQQENPVTETRPENHWFSWIEVQTDAEGRWSINRIAEDMLPRIYGSARHPDHVGSPMVFTSQDAEAEKALRAGTHVFRLGRAVVVSGVVVDPEDRPVPGAKVLAGSVGSSGSRETTAGADGTFTIGGFGVGQGTLTAEAAGYAATTLTIDLRTNTGPFRIQLAAGRVLRLRVVDKAGQPVAGARIWYNNMDRGPIGAGPQRSAPVQASWSPSTDAEGRAVWQNAPDQELAFDVMKRGYLRVSSVRFRADGQEHLVTLPPALTISGTVTDATAGKPVPRFRIVCGWPEANPIEGGTRPRWSTIERFWPSFAGGKFRHSLEEAVVGGMANPGYVFKFEAEGYAPHVTRTVAPDEGEVFFEVTLQPASSTTLTVLQPDGRPAANADVGLVSSGAQLRLRPGGFDRTSGASGGSVLTTDAKGQVRLPPDESIRKVVVVHAQGFAEATSAKLQAEPTLQLQAWGRVEGVYWKGGKPAAGQELLPGLPGEDALSISFDFMTCKIQTDGAGRFAFAKLPSGHLRLMHLVSIAQKDGGTSWIHEPLTDVEVRPGERTWIEPGKADRSVTLRLRWPAGWQAEPGWQTWAMIGTPLPYPPLEVRTNQAASLQWTQRPENRAAFASARSFSLKDAGSGTWIGEDVTPGRYLVRVFVRDANGPQGADNLRARFEGPVEVPADSSTGPVDLGEIPLEQMPQ